MKKLAITMGDPAGVGPELIGRILEKHPKWSDIVCVLGNRDFVSGLSDRFAVEVVETTGGLSFKAGEPSVEGATAALDAMTKAAQGCLDGQFSGVVTGPISKYWCQQAGMKHPGQTEYFASKWNGTPTMAFISPKMRVALATWHIPLMQVKTMLTQEVLNRCLDHTAALLQQLRIDNPRVGVCGLNPHAGEQGQLGTEEQEFLNPWIADWRSRNSEVTLSECQPSDTVFYRHLEGEFDAVVALYHDQALAPVKTVAFHEAVNTTLGLTFIRTSPDHGTAFDIAGKGIARTESFESAIRLAGQLSGVIC